MIVRPAEHELHLIHQHEHGQLAAGIARYHGEEEFPRPEPFDSLVRATANHDIGWKEPDGEPLLDEDSGRPLHFLDVDWDRHARFYRQGVERVTEQDPMAGLLVSMHWTGLYCRRWGTQPDFEIIPADRREEFDRIIAEEQQRWVQLKQQAWDSSEEPRREFENRLWVAYEWLQFWDRFSIFICSESLTPGARLELGPVRGAEAYRSIQLEVIEPNTVAAAPFPFAPAVFEVTYKGRVVPDRQYDSVSELNEELDGKPDTTFRCRVVDGAKV